MRISLQDCVDYSPKTSFKDDSLMATGTSIPFRTVSRDKKPHWSNRFTKDVNDLEYDINYDLIGGKSLIKGKQLEGLKQFKKNCKVGVISARNSHKLSPKESKSKMMKSRLNEKMDLVVATKIKSSQTVELPYNPYSTVNTAGLCQYQYKNTIAGRMKFKTNHHLQFAHQTAREANEHRIWHNPELELTFQKIKARIKRASRDKMHAFNSYTKRKVFEGELVLDKFYDTQTAWKRVSSFRERNNVQVKKVPGRTPEKSRLSEHLHLTYRKQAAQDKLLSRPISHNISRSQKQFQIPRQVIFPGRGCYR